LDCRFLGKMPKDFCSMVERWMSDDPYGAPANRWPTGIC